MLMKRRAITHPTPGVTRDSIEAELLINGMPATLIDTGGFTLGKDPLQNRVKKKTLSLIEDADLILFVVDIDEMTGEDREFAGKLNRVRDKIILVVNKVDNAKDEISVFQKHELGFKRLVGVSAEHGRNIKTLFQEIEIFFAENFGKNDARKENHKNVIRIALLGKPNTGKSTLINYILNEEKAITSELPGTTRDVLEGFFMFDENKIVIRDTAGIRRKKQVENPVEYYSVSRAIGAIDESDVVILIVDVMEGFSEQDKKIASLVEKKGRGMIICLNKWDLQKKLPNTLRAISDRIEFLYPPARNLPMIPVSAKTGEGVEKMLRMTVRINRELDLRVDTGELNRALLEWKSKYDIPLKKNIRLRYMTQVGTRPIRFVLFANSLRRFPGSYLLYLKNRLREQFGFTHVPIEIEVRKAN